MTVLEDEQTCSDLLACLSGTKQHLSHDPARCVEAITQAVAAVRQHGHCVSHELMPLFILGTSIFQLERGACNTKVGAQANKHGECSGKKQGWC